MSVDGKYWIIFNGEIYNFKDIRLDLSSKGYKFYSDSDTEVILNAYKEWGVESFKKFNGMWCFAILDKEKKRSSFLEIDMG
jgi:asparagine synthase (glutamine-hydrolysing)